jgi:ABC-type sugar transport system substrate-binding protein
VTSSTPALASFRRLSKAAINAAGVSKCASERNRVVVSALASSDNRLSSVDTSDDDRDKAFAETQTLLKVFPRVRLVVAIAAPAVPGAAEAVRQGGRSDVKVIGLSLPNINKPYVHGGVVQTVVLWNTRDLGYLTVYAGANLVENRLQSGARSITAGRLGSREIRGDEIILGPPLVMNASNIDQFDF